MKKNKAALLLASVLLLSGCGVALNEIYDGPILQNPDFVDNYYTPKKAFDDISPKAVFELDEHGETVTYIDSLSLNQDAVIKLLMDDARLYSETMSNEARDLLNEYLQEYDKYLTDLHKYENEGGVGEKPLQPNDIVYGQRYFKTVSLGNTDESFRRGYFSKLTDGITMCDGRGAAIRMQINEAGIQQKFAKELTDYSSLIFALRGGTNIPWAELGGFVNKARVKINLDFYIYTLQAYELVRFTFEVDVVSDSAGSTSLIHLNLRKLLEDQPDLIYRMSGLGISYELLEHGEIKPDGVDANSEYEFALMLYEFALPYSRWN